MPTTSGMLAVEELGEDLSDVLGVPVDIVPEHLVKPGALPGLRRMAVAL
jgi:predicted nucleotidyltransferase